MRKIFLFIIASALFVSILVACSTKVLTNETKGDISSSERNQVSSITSLNSSSSISPSVQTVDVFMQYVNDHGYKVLPNSEAGCVIKLPNFYNVKSSDTINVILNKAYESSKKLGFDILPYQDKTVTFHTCAVDLGNGLYSEADCFTDNNKIIGFWTFTASANPDKMTNESFIIMNPRFW